MFTKAIVRKPCKAIVNGITTANLGTPSYEKALQQHTAYKKVLTECGLQVFEVDANEQFPDSVFIEDTALVTPQMAVITNPGAVSRKGEVLEVETFLSKFFQNIERISSPGTLDAGDVMMVGGHFYIGISARTNFEGALQLIKILARYGYTGSTIHLESVLHLKTGISYLENNNLLASGEFLGKPELKNFNIIEVPHEESYASNSLWVNNTVIVPEGYPQTLDRIQKAGYRTIIVDTSEFRKLDGGLSCLSLRF